MNFDEILDLISRWNKKHILVVGDVMLDKYIYGDVHRISPEAPIPIVNAQKETLTVGGAANVSENLINLGGSVTLFGIIGNDENGTLLRGKLNPNITAELLVDEERPTTTKTRIINGSQQLLRIDNESTKESITLLQQITKIDMSIFDGVILSDYAKGALSSATCQYIIAQAKKFKIPVLVDPKQNDITRYSGATCICPNFQEFKNIIVDKTDDLLLAGQNLLQKFDLQSIAVTMGEKGIALITRIGVQVFPAVAKQVFDVSGAGDTVISILSLSQTANLTLDVAAPLANIGAGIVIGKAGTTPIELPEFVSSFDNSDTNKIMLESVAARRILYWRSQNKSIVFTNGCFDLLHAGHIKLLSSAKKLGDKLIIGLNSDSSIQLLKGLDRPINNELNRAEVLSALDAVDAIIIFDDQTPQKLIETIKPDVLCKGGDYADKSIVGDVFVKSYGGKVTIIPIVTDISTTKIIEKTRQ
jgi:D-beta-D-heptose 7-phosphate kinase/D-beta-D-heptose 1-phosphate adenosyltransferase